MIPKKYGPQLFSLILSGLPQNLLLKFSPSLSVK